ncbi:hypothetical protein PGT21_017493 [Puccinia graminis f. sp. tritici]|uniref:Uncharacterized protein n=1 Tax=Puccinia graminis f. sp. tritici TaxID=56615 RepID=A0A5B0NXT9_PUCGR|nr:hypothetical protein PGT21_017493 [Puccinia graminis f. sp. tritici]KAA1093334.1 hypothetical protein PGTUg99_022576 [Puccinia graminis f. sp. tritici]
MLRTKPKTTCLLFPNESDFITVLEVGAPKEFPAITSCIKPKSPQKQLKQPKEVQKRGARLMGSKAGLLPTLLAPSVLRTIVVKSIIQRNHQRHAKIELGLYLLLDSEPSSKSHSLKQLEPCSPAEDYWLDASETSISFNDSLPAHLYTPRRLPMIQLLKNWWRYR